MTSYDVNITELSAILIKNLYLSKQYGARRLLRELPDKGWKLWSIDSLLKRSHKTGTIVLLRAALDRICCVAVKNLVLSQEDQPKRHRWAR